MSNSIKIFIGQSVILFGLSVLPAAQATAGNPGTPLGEGPREGMTVVEGLRGGLPVESVSPARPISDAAPDVLEPLEERNRQCTPAISAEDLRDPDDPTSGFSGTGIYGGRPPQEEAEREPVLQGLEVPPGPDPQWGDDVLVHDGFPYGHADWDEDEDTGDLYAIVDLSHFAPDTNLIYRSTDGGENWAVWSRLVNSDGHINQAKLRVARDAAGETWICAFGIWGESDPAQRILWMGQKPAIGGNWTWSMVDDDVTEMDVDADVGDGANVYVVYIPEDSELDIWAARHTLSGGWEENQLLFSNPATAPYPQIAAGGGGTVYVAFIDTRLSTSDEVRIKRSTDSGATWLGSQQVSDNSGGFPLSYTDVASSRGETQTAWIFASFDVSGSGEGYNIAYYTSTDSGASWAYADILGYSTDDEWNSTLRARKASGSATVAYMAGVGVDSVMVSATTASDPEGFYEPLRANDTGTEGVFPTAGWMTRGGWAFPAVLFDGWEGTETIRDVYFDWIGNGTIFIALIPDETVVPRGGTLSMTAYATNAWNTDQTIDFWTNVTLPNGNTWPADETLLGPITTTLEAGETVSARITHRIPGNAPLLTYTYNGFLGPDFPVVWTSYSFSFEVVPAADLTGTGDAEARESTGEVDEGIRGILY